MASARWLFRTGGHDQVMAELVGAYADCIKAMTTPKNKLDSLDNFWRKTLPALLQERDAEGGAYVTKEELYKIMKWKITRGKSRPLLHLIESNDDATIRRVSREAFAALTAAGDEEARVRRAIEIMSQKAVKGVGPATASAVLAAYRGDLAPFMADEAVAAAVPFLGKLKYTLDEYLQFRKTIVTRAKAFNGSVTAEMLGQALWALAKVEVLGLDPLERNVEKGKGTKRGAAPAPAPAQAKKARQK